jgi:streptogramin lyase
MSNSFFAISLGALIVTTTLSVGLIPAKAQLPPGITDHGIAAPLGMAAWGGTMVTEDAEGNRLVFIKLWAGGKTSYLYINAETGEHEQLPPGEGHTGSGAYSVFLSPDNKVYDTLAEWMLEIDVHTRQVRRIGQLPGGFGFSWTMSPEGVVYCALYPTATLLAYDPATDTFTDYGQIHEEEWPIYPERLAVDDAGWVYCGIGLKATQVVGFNPATGQRRTFIPDEQREQAAGSVFRCSDGKVYANARGWGYHELYAGEAVAVEKPPVGADSYLRPATQFPDGTRAQVDVHNRNLRILDAEGETVHEVAFDYESDGVNIYSMVAGTDGKIWGATGIPLRIWCFDPQSDQMDNWGLGNHGGHANQMVLQGDKIYGAVYSSGSLIELDVTQPVDDTNIQKSTNPRHVHGYEYGVGKPLDMFGRPHALLAHPDGRHVIMGGNPARAQVGGGLLFYDTETGEQSVLKPDELLPDQGVKAICALPDGDLIVGSTTEAATAASPSAAPTAMLYHIDWATRRLVEKWPFEPPTAVVNDLVVAGDGIVYGLAAGNRFFAFDPRSGQFIHDEQVTQYGAVTGMQAPRTMAIGPDGGIYVLFRDAIARFEPGTFEHREIVRPGPSITAGIVISDSRLYFACNRKLYSYDLSLDTLRYD